MIILPKRYRRKQGGFIAGTFFDQAMVARATPSGGGGPTIDPPDTDPNLWAWWSTDTSLGATDTGSYKSAGTWTDRSGNGRQWVITGGGVVKLYDGAYASSGLASGKPALHFDRTEVIGGSSAGFYRSALSTGQPSPPFSIYMLIRITNWAANNYIFMLEGTNGCGWISEQTASGGNGVGIYSGNAWVSAAISSGWHVASFISNGASSKAQVDNNTQVTGNAGSNTPSGFGYLGSYFSGTANSMRGDLAALIISAGANDATQQTKHKNWLANYGGLTI